MKSIVEESGRLAVLLPGDLSDRSFCEQLPTIAARELDGLDALVSNADKQISVENIADLPDDQWVSTFETNILATFRISKAALPHMPAGSTIVNATSIQTYKPSAHLLDYASTKAAINNFTKGLAQQVAPRGIRVRQWHQLPFGPRSKFQAGSHSRCCPTLAKTRHWDELDSPQNSLQPTCFSRRQNQVMSSVRR